MKGKQLMPGQVEGRQCGGKVCYKSKAMALKAMKSAREMRKTRKAHIERRVYRCPACHFWHVTSLSIEKGKEFGSQARERRKVMRGIECTLSGSLPADEAFEVLTRMNEDRLAGKGMSSADSYIIESKSEDLKEVGESTQPSTGEDLKGIKKSTQPTTEKGLKGTALLDSNNSILDKNNHSSDGDNKLLDTNNDERTGIMSDAVPSPADVARKHAVVYASRDIRSAVKRVPVPGGVLLILPKNAVVMSPEKSKALRSLGIVEEVK